MEERTGWRGQNESQTGEEEKKNGRLYGVAETSKKRAEWRRLQRKNLNKLGLLKRKEWPQCHRESSWQERRSHPCLKEKEQRRLPRVPDHEGERVYVGESRTLARVRGIRAKAWSGKGGLDREEGRFQGGQGGQATRASLGQVEGSMSESVDARALLDDLQSLGFTPSLAKPEIRKEVGRRRARS